MLPFFRKIRWRLAANNQFFKYSRYAFGEIVLVVIGILIALQINNRNEQLKSDAKIDVLFEKVLIELVANINETQKVFQNSKYLDTLGYLVEGNNLAYDDYAKPKQDENGNRVLIYLYFPYSYEYDMVFLNTSAYNNLILNMDLVPSEYDQVVSELNIMYSTDKKAIDIANMDMIDFVKDIKSEHRKKYKWYSDHLFRPNRNKAMIDYMLNNYLYKNEVRGYWNLSRAQLNNTLSYRNRAVRIYQELAALLNKPTVHDSFKVNPEAVELISGTYQYITENENEEGHLESYGLEENLIIMTQDRNSNIAWEHTLLDFNTTKSRSVISMLRNSGAIYMTYIVAGDSLSVINNSGNTWKFIKVK